MQSRRFVLEDLEPDDRVRFATMVFDQLTQDLALQFPPEKGFAQRWDFATDSLLITRGRWWGLEISLRSHDSAGKRWDWNCSGFFPAVRRITVPLGRFVNWGPGTRLGNTLWAHLVVPLYLVPGMAALPFLFLYRVAALALEKDVLAAAHRLDLLWPSLEANWPGARPALEKHTPAFNLLLVCVAAGAASALCVRAMDRPGISDNTSSALLIAAIFLGLASLVALIGLILSALGFEVRR